MAITAIIAIKVISLISYNFISLQRKLAYQDEIGMKIRPVIWWCIIKWFHLVKMKSMKAKCGNYGSNVSGYDMQSSDTIRFIDKDIAGEVCVCVKVLDYEINPKLSNEKCVFYALCVNVMDAVVNSHRRVHKYVAINAYHGKCPTKKIGIRTFSTTKGINICIRDRLFSKFS